MLLKPVFNGVPVSKTAAQLKLIKCFTTLFRAKHGFDSKNIDLERFNVALHPQPSTNKDQLVYLFTRQATVFIPAGKSTRDHKSFIIPTQLSSTSDGYNHSLKCFIIFKFKQNLAESIEFKGRGC